MASDAFVDSPMVAAVGGLVGGVKAASSSSWEKVCSLSVIIMIWSFQNDERIGSALLDILFYCEGCYRKVLVDSRRRIRI